MEEEYLYAEVVAENMKKIYLYHIFVVMVDDPMREECKLEIVGTSGGNARSFVKKELGMQGLQEGRNYRITGIRQVECLGNMENRRFH